MGGGTITTKPILPADPDRCDWTWELDGQHLIGGEADLICTRGTYPCNDPQGLYVIEVGGAAYLYAPDGQYSLGSPPSQPRSFYFPLTEDRTPDLGLAVIRQAGQTRVQARAGLPIGDLGSLSYYEKALPNGFVIPYDSQTAGAQGGNGAAPGFFLTRLTNCVLARNGSTPPCFPISGFTFAPEGDVTLPANGPFQWDLTGLTLQFGPNRRLLVDKQLNVTGGTLTASNPVQGWGGIRFQPGASGSLVGTSQPVVVSEVAGYGGTASVYVHDAEVSLDNVVLDGRPQLPEDYDQQVMGLYVTGSDALVNLHNSIFTVHTDFDLWVSGGARFYGSGNTFSNDIYYSGLFAYGFYGGADLYLWDNPVISNATAQSYGTVWLGPADYGTPLPFPNNSLLGRPSNSSYARTITASNHAAVYGDWSKAQNNDIRRNGGASPGTVSGASYSVLTPEYAYWGQSSGPLPRRIERRRDFAVRLLPVPDGPW